MSVDLSGVGRARGLWRAVRSMGRRWWVALAATALILLMVGLWWLGPDWSWRGHTPLASLAVRLGLTFVLIAAPLALWGGVMRSRYHRLRDQQVRQIDAQSDSILAFEAAQQQSLDASLHLLRRNLKRRDFLHALPWYVVIGQEGAGKTSFINRSSQSFSLSGVERAAAEKKDGNGPVLSIDWWISDDAVLIDPAGELICQKQHESVGDAPGPASIIEQERVLKLMQEHPDVAPRLWRHFVGWLGRSRPRRPLNGAILIVDLALLLVQQPSDRKALALLIRSRLRELMEQLGTRLPVYVVLSKFDMVRGFDAFFAGLPREAREATLGFTCTLDSVDNFDAWLPELSQQYDGFVERLNEQVFDAMASRSDPDEREDLYVFSRQVSGLKPLLFLFLSEILESDRYSTPALVRGMYFASVFQQGIPANALVNAVGRSYGLPPTAANALPPGKASSYFTHGLFQKIVYPEAGLAGDNISILGRKRRALWTHGACAALVSLIAVGSWHYHFQQNRQKAYAVLEKSQSFNATGIDDGLDPTGRNLLVALNQIRDAVSVYDDYRTSWPHVAGFGLYQGHEIGPKVDAAYMRLLGQRFLPQLAQGVLAHMDDADLDSDGRLAALRVYRMIEDRPNRTPAYIESWMAGIWHHAFPADDDTQSQLMTHLRYALTYVDAQLPQQPLIVRNTQAELRRTPLPQRVYTGMKRDAAESLPAPLDLRAEVGPVFDVLYKQSAHITPGAEVDLRISRLLTAEGFNGYFLSKSKDVEALALTDQWTLGYRSQLKYSQEDSNRLAEQIRDLYAADYIATWRRSLNGLQVTDFRDLDHAVLVLEQASGTSQPFRRLIESVSRNSRLEPGEQLPTTDNVQPHVAAGDLRPARRIDREFSAMAQLQDSPDGQPGQLEEIQRAMLGLHDYMKSIQSSPSRGQTALDALTGQSRREGVDPIFLVRRMSAGLPEPINRQVGKLADESERVLALEAIQELEKRWEHDVHDFYRQRLAGRYPLAPASAQNVDLADFEAFFGPKGRLQAFHDQYLAPLLMRGGSGLQDQYHGKSLVASNLMPQFERAQRIREAFFNERGGLGLQFSVQPLALSPDHLNSILSVDGQLLNYAHGPRSVTGLIWPNALRESVESRLTLVGAVGQTRTVRYQGPWAWFRLLSQAQLNGRTPNSVDLSFRTGSGAVRYRINSEKSVNPFTQEVFSGFVLPRSLLPTGGQGVPAAAVVDPDRTVPHSVDAQETARSAQSAAHEKHGVPAG